MSTGDTLYVHRVHGRELIVRGADDTVRCEIRDEAGAVATLAPGTVSVYRSDGTAVVDAAAFTNNASGIAEYTVPAATTADLVLEGGWRVEFTGTLPDGTTRTFRNEALLVRQKIHPPVTDADLYTIQSRLDPNDDHPITRHTTYFPFIRAAWLEIEDMLVNRGRRPELVMSPSAFRRPLLFLSLANVFDDATQGAYESWSEIAMKYRRQFEAAWADMNFTYDEDEDGNIDGGSEPERTGADGTVWLASRGHRDW